MWSLPEFVFCSGVVVDVVSARVCFLLGGGCGCGLCPNLFFSLALGGLWMWSLPEFVFLSGGVVDVVSARIWFLLGGGCGCGLCPNLFFALGGLWI